MRIIDGTRVDLVLTDSVMPQMDGLTLTRLIGQRFPSLPVVLTTGLTTVTAAAERHGASVLLKPYSVEQLAAAISERLSANQPPRVSSPAGSGLAQVAPSRVEQAREHIARGEAIVSRQSDIVRHLMETGSTPRSPRECYQRSRNR